MKMESLQMGSVDFEKFTVTSTAKGGCPKQRTGHIPAVSEISIPQAYGNDDRFAVVRIDGRTVRDPGRGYFLKRFTSLLFMPPAPRELRVRAVFFILYRGAGCAVHQRGMPA